MFKRTLLLVRKGFKYYFITVGALTTGVVVSLYYFRKHVALQAQQRFSNNMLLELNLNEMEISEEPTTFSLDAKISMREIVEGLKLATQDPRVKGLVVSLPTMRPAANVAQIQELREAIEEFGKEKETIAFAENYTQGNYYLASAFNKIYMQPSGTVELTGLQLRKFFIKGLLDRLGIGVEVFKVGEYKTAVTPFLETKFTEAEKENTASILNSLFSEMLENISKSRKMSTEKLQNIIDHSPTVSKESLQEGLIDGILYPDEIGEELKKSSPAFVNLKSYARSSLQHSKKEDKIALIYLTDAIVDPKKTSKIRKAFAAATVDPTVKAIVVRVDCPGGTTFAADAIGRMIDLAQKKNKVVVASVGNVCASGGYWVVAPSDSIFASPGSIVGSIGVFFTKPVIGQFLSQMLGITSDDMKIGKNAGMVDIIEPYSESQKEKVQSLVESAYDDFVERVSKGRKMPKEKVLSIAGGRIFTGRDAKAVGLVDNLGGLTLAIDHARTLAKVDKTTPAVVYVSPKKITDIIREIFAGNFTHMMVDMLESEVISNYSFLQFYSMISQEENRKK